jgi:hypothetical protein
MLTVDRTTLTTDDPAPWLHLHRAQQRLRSYYEPVRRRVPRRYSLPCGSAAWQAPSRHPQRGTAVSGHAFPRSAREQQTGLTSPTCRTPPGQSAVTRQAHPGLTYYTPVLMPSTELRHLDSDPQNEDCAPSFRSPPDASRAPFPHRSPRRSSANAACGGLKPPTAGRLRRANLHLLHSTMFRSPYLQTELPSTFVAHVDSRLP